MRHNANAIRYMPWRHVPRATKVYKAQPLEFLRQGDKEPSEVYEAA